MFWLLLYSVLRSSTFRAGGPRAAKLSGICLRLGSIVLKGHDGLSAPAFYGLNTDFSILGLPYLAGLPPYLPVARLLQSVLRLRVQATPKVHNPKPQTLDPLP